MDLKLHIYGALCATSEFTINGIDASIDDFGEKYDRDCDNAPDYGCGDMRFTRIDSTTDVLNKYDITELEFSDICEKLEEWLSFGNCGWCI